MRDLLEPTDHCTDNPIDLTFTVRGASAPQDHRYLLHAAIKQNACRRMTERGWKPRAIQGGRVTDEEALHFHRKDDPPALQMRVPADDLEEAMTLADQPLRLSQHILMLENPQVREVKPSNTLESDLVLVRNSSRAPRGYRAPDLGIAIGKQLGAAFGHIDFGVAMGERRWVHIDGVRHFGHPVRVTALTDDESMWLQRNGLGRSLSMGCGTFWPCDDGLDFE